MRKILLSDYDGTITDKDFYSLLAERYIPGDTPDYFAQYREGRITHFEAMAAYGVLRVCAYGGTATRRAARSQPSRSGLGRVSGASAPCRLGTLGSFGWLLMVRRARSQAGRCGRVCVLEPGTAGERARARNGEAGPHVPISFGISGRG
jgi:hypothetical protein